MDELLLVAIELILMHEISSPAFLQRRLKIGYKRTKKLINIIETMGIIGPEIVDYQRVINMTLDEWLFIKEKRTPEMFNANHKISEEKINEIWAKAFLFIQSELTEVSFNTWIRPIKATYEDNHVLLRVDNKFNKEIIEKRYLQLITHAIQQAAVENLSVKVVVFD